MNDDEMDNRVIHGARDYNEPNAVPREEMWARIAEARHAARDAERAKPAAKTAWRWTPVAIAAGVILAAGIVIGRSLEQTSPSTAPAVAAVTPPTDSARDTIVPQLREETRKTGQRVQELASASVPPSTTGNAAVAEPNLAYRLVMLRHIAGSEAMITAFRASSRRGEMDAQIAGWARELLSTTRMLEASPVTQDPTMKRLLDDLDLVLTQIAQYVTKGTINTEELDLIEQSITKRGVITKLRSTLPARNASAGT